MQRLNKSITHAVDRPVKVMQFGEGNFLRAFVDYIFDVTNEKTDFNGGVVIVKPIEFGTLERFHDQECQYTLQLRGFVDGIEMCGKMYYNDWEQMEYNRHLQQ